MSERFEFLSNKVLHEYNEKINKLNEFKISSDLITAKHIVICHRIAPALYKSSNSFN